MGCRRKCLSTFCKYKPNRVLIEIGTLRTSSHPQLNWCDPLGPWFSNWLWFFRHSHHSVPKPHPSLTFLPAQKKTPKLTFVYTHRRAQSRASPKCWRGIRPEAPPRITMFLLQFSWAEHFQRGNVFRVVIVDEDTLLSVISDFCCLLSLSLACLFILPTHGWKTLF